MRTHSSKGFTLIELLIVLGVVGLISVFAAVAVNAARSKQRDATRLSQVRQLQSGLEDYFNETNAYPAGDMLPLGDGSQSGCLSSMGFQASCQGSSGVYLRVVTGTIDKGLKGLALCGTPARNAFCYTQTLDGSGYDIEFELENTLTPVGLAKGINCATPEGIEAGSCR